MTCTRWETRPVVGEALDLSGVENTWDGTNIKTREDDWRIAPKKVEQIWKGVCSLFSLDFTFSSVWFFSGVAVAAFEKYFNIQKWKTYCTVFQAKWHHGNPLCFFLGQWTVLLMSSPLSDIQGNICQAAQRCVQQDWHAGEVVLGCMLTEPCNGPVLYCIIDCHL